MLVYLQVHVDPLGQSRDLIDLCRSNGIQLVAYSTLGTQYWQPGKPNPVLNNPKLKEIAAKLGKSVAQVTLRWALQEGLIVLPRSSKAQHMKESLELFDFSLSADDMEQIRKLNGHLSK